MTRHKTSPNEDSWIVTLSTFPPRVCGIATFTKDLTDAMATLFEHSVRPKIIAMRVGEKSATPPPRTVMLEIHQERLEDYREAALAINRIAEVKLVNIEHEFGIFGGADGSHLLAFMETIQKPVVLTFHTVLPAPSENQRILVQSLSKKASKIIAMTDHSKAILETVYGIQAASIATIPHGIHPVRYCTTLTVKKKLGLSNTFVLTTFGFLNRNKGIEYVLDALPRVIRTFPHVRYLILGVTHPEIVKREGETYRESLEKKVRDLGIGENIQFINAFLKKEELLEYLEATDLYIATPLDPNQAVSGTLSYALGTGRAVIATPFPQAREIITEDVGVLVPFRDPEAITHKIQELLAEPIRLAKLGRNAYLKTRKMTWPNVAISTMKLFSTIIHQPGLQKKRFPRMKLDHLVRMTDSFGMIQFADLSEPNLESGYTLDDNARALMVSVEDFKQFHHQRSLDLINIYLEFIQYLTIPTGGFFNVVSYNREIPQKENEPPAALEDANGRGMLALAVAATSSFLPKAVQEQARAMLTRNLQSAPVFGSARAAAFFIKALTLLCGLPEYAPHRESMVRYCNWLVTLYEGASSPEWEWFEDRLTYSNAVLPEALLQAYQITGTVKYFEVGNKTLDFLIRHGFRDGIYVPIGQKGWFVKGKEREVFDQQPEDTAAMLQVLKTMHKITSNEKYRKMMEECFGWFLGDNILGQALYDPITGGCYDGIGTQFINLDQGAESTLSYLASRQAFES